jgi:Ser/Thr protein kinase RdoA (MazF antagonist)
LYVNDVVGGLIDYGSVKIDHVAADLARLLGSLVEDEPAERDAGLAAYARVADWPAEMTPLVDVLDETGTVLGVATWLGWLYREGRIFADAGAVARRLATLVRRMERWEQGAARPGSSAVVAAR